MEHEKHKSGTSIVIEIRKILKTWGGYVKRIQKTVWKSSHWPNFGKLEHEDNDSNGLYPAE